MAAGATAAAGLLLAAVFLAGPTGPAATARAAAGPNGLAPDPDVLREQVRDPLFAMVFLLTEADSLGTWTAADVEAFAGRWGGRSDFPVAEHLESLTREALPPDQVRERRGLRCDRRWLVRLSPARLEMPMPYSILGYHPGSLSFQTPIELHEWRLGHVSLQVPDGDGGQVRRPASGVTIWQITGGWIILDVDAWVDRLLGKAADDAAMAGFTAARVGGDLVGVGNSTGRDGRRLLGELDFRSGEVATHGRPVAKGLSWLARRWLREPGEDPREVWRRYEAD